MDMLSCFVYSPPARASCNHRSFAHRQIDVYERELGWSFWTWKLDKHAEGTAHSAPLWSFRLVRLSETSNH